MRAEEIRDERTLKAWLKNQPREVAVMNASRAALRVVPLWSAFFRWELSKKRASTFVLALFRCALTTGVAVVDATPEVRVAANAAAANATATANATAAAAAAAAALAAYAAGAANAYAYAYAADAAAAADDAESIWSAIRSDALAVASGASARQVLSTPIWGSEAPEDILKEWGRLRAALEADAPDWAFWIDWYEGVLAGRTQNWEMLTEIVLIPNVDWRQRPRHVNAIIAGIVEKHRALEVVAAEAPPLDPALPMRMTEAGIALGTVNLTGDEAMDPVRQTLHEALREQVTDLIRISGNRDEAAYREACRLRDLLESGLAQMDPLRVHLAVEALRRIHDRAPADTDRHLMLALAQVIETGPGLTLDTGPVALHIDRVQRNRLERLSTEETEAQIRLARGMATSELSAPDVQDLAAKVSDPVAEDQLSLLRPTLTRNYVILVGRTVVGVCAGATVGHFAVTGEVGWLAAHGADILLAARSWGAPYVAWITPLVARAQEIVAGAEQMQAQISRNRRDAD